MKMNFLGLGSAADVDIILHVPEGRQMMEYRQEDGRRESAPLYYDGEDIVGTVKVNLKKGKLEHQGIKLEYIGQIEMFYDRGNHHEFVALMKELKRPGEIHSSEEIDFKFEHVMKPFETYCGTNVKLRYFVRVTVTRRLTDIVREQDIVVHSLAAYPDTNGNLKMEVGIEESLHIEFEYNKSKYHLGDTIVGKIYFLLVRVKIKYMELSILRKELTGYGPGTFDTAESTVARYEIMDGAPVRGESIPIRLFLAAYPEMTPTMKDVQKKFSVRYYLNLVLVDEEDRRYFKQQEITLWRKGEKLKSKIKSQQEISSIENNSIQ